MAGRSVTDGTTEVVVALDYPVDPKTGEPTDDTIVVATPEAPLAAGTTYTVTVDEGTIADVAGGQLAEGISFTFTTAE